MLIFVLIILISLEKQSFPIFSRVRCLTSICAPFNDNIGSFISHYLIKLSIKVQGDKTNFNETIHCLMLVEFRIYLSIKRKSIK